MRKLIDGLIDLMYPRAPGEPDRDPLWVKLFVLGMFTFLIVLGILGS